MGQLNLFVSSEEMKGAHEFGNFTLYISTLFTNLGTVIKKYFLTYSFHTTLIWANIILFFFNIKKTNFYEKLSQAILLLGFLVIQSILLFRYEQDTYYLNSEILLLIALSINLKFIYNFKFLALICVVMFLLLIHPIKSNLISIKKINSYSYCKNIDFNFYEYYTNKIPLKDVEKLCLNYNTSK